MSAQAEQNALPIDERFSAKGAKLQGYLCGLAYSIGVLGGQLP
jgi:hypothetical protein